ncbi:hypothetical protein QA644_07550 [Rhizobium sp. CC1099]|uniref:hypothetical protein n=1 Tax=Rhizobium sp. CC1099 TaxID=3039160 RepID=UPI0024B1B7F7|nr:hypothetical protein [Rhizobium sp. CC1099]WFU88893.1 hypothetical protein QA644_07550 [Rhizobium sp. CC1099]
MNAASYRRTWSFVPRQQMANAKASAALWAIVFCGGKVCPALAFSHGCKPSSSSCLWRRVLAGSTTEEDDAPGRGRDRAIHVHHPNGADFGKLVVRRLVKVKTVKVPVWEDATL